MYSPKFVRIPRFAELTGFTEKAVRKNIEAGVWVEGIHYSKKGRIILMNLEAYDKWADEKCAA